MSISAGETGRRAAIVVACRLSCAPVAALAGTFLAPAFRSLAERCAPREEVILLAGDLSTTPRQLPAGDNAEELERGQRRPSAWAADGC